MSSVRNIPPLTQFHATTMTFHATMSKSLDLGWETYEHHADPSVTCFPLLLSLPSGDSGGGRLVDFSTVPRHSDILVTEASVDGKFLTTRLAWSVRFSVSVCHDGTAELSRTKSQAKRRLANGVPEEYKSFSVENETDLLLAKTAVLVGGDGATLERRHTDGHYALLDAVRASSHFDLPDGKPFSSSCVCVRSYKAPHILTKIFRKGAVHLAGCKHHIEALCMIEDLADLMSTMCGIGSGVTVETIETNMINATTFVDVALYRSKLARILLRDKSSLGIVKAMTHQEKYNVSLEVQFNSTFGKGGVKCSAKVFDSGSILLSARAPADLSAMLHVLVTTIDTHASEVAIPDGEHSFAPPKLAWTTVVKGVPGLAHSHLPCRGLVPGCAYCQRRGNTLPV